MTENYRMDIKERFPLLRGPDDVTEGYFELEEHERNTKLHAYLQHRDAIALWYRGLTLYRRGTLGQWDFTDVGDDSLSLAVFRLQMQLLGLGVSTAKSALDDLLAGYYSLAFAAIRHMTETYIVYLYVAVKPEKYRLWYEDPLDPTSKKKTPPCSHMVKVLKKSQAMKQIGFSRRAVGRIFGSWALMSKGAHPTGEGIEQTRSGSQEGKSVIGATYNEYSCLVGFDHGLFALISLLNCLIGLRPQNATWRAAHDQLITDVNEWRKQMGPRALQLLAQT